MLKRFFPIFTNPTCWDGFKCSKDGEIVLSSSRDGVHYNRTRKLAGLSLLHDAIETSVANRQYLYATAKASLDLASGTFYIKCLCSFSVR